MLPLLLLTMRVRQQFMICYSENFRVIFDFFFIQHFFQQLQIEKLKLTEIENFFSKTPLKGKPRMEDSILQYMYYLKENH